jgi:hypothetical protein
MSSAHRYAFSVTIAITMLSAIAEAQGTDSLPSFTHVRIASPILGEGKHEARVLSVGSDHLVFQLNKRRDSVTLRRGQLTSLERAMGERRRVRRGMGIGFLTGAAIGGVAGASAQGANCEPDSFFTCENPNNAALAVVGGLAVGALGMIVGGVVGAFVRTERWVPLERAWWTRRVSLGAPSTGGARVSMTF